MRVSFTRALAFLLVIAFMLPLVGCSSNKLDVSDEALALAKDVLRSTDRALDGLATVDSAISTADSAYDKLEEIKDYGDNAQLQTKVWTVFASLSTYKSYLTKETKAAIEERRNSLIKSRDRLAESIGEKKYSQ